jgi:hypothetical protein
VRSSSACVWGSCARLGSEGRRRGPYALDGNLVTERPDQMWGTNATMGYTKRDG